MTGGQAARKKTSPCSAKLRNTPKSRVDLRKDRYAGVRNRTMIVTHVTQLRNSLRNTSFCPLTYINLDHLEGCYAVTQKEIYAHAREAEGFTPSHVGADRRPPLPSVPENLSEEEDGTGSVLTEPKERRAAAASVTRARPTSPAGRGRELEARPGRAEC